jgi:Protein of unknown function (DUF2750)
MSNELAKGKANHEKFVQSAVKTEAIWILRDDEGAAFRESDDDGRSVLQFWPNAPEAEASASDDWAECVPEKISLYDFLYRWLPNMEADELLVGTHGAHDQPGLELEPFELEEDLKAAMGAELVEKYEAQIGEELKAAKGKEGKGKDGKKSKKK